MKKMLCVLVLIFVMLMTTIPTWAVGNLFIISKAEIVGVANGNEYKIDQLSKGTIRAKMKFSNFTSETQEVTLYIASKDDETNRLISVNTKTVTVPASSVNQWEYIDIEVADNMKENLNLYVWDKAQTAYCEVERWEKVPPEDIIEVKAIIAETIYTDSALWKKDDAEIVELDLLRVYDAEDKIKYTDILYDNTGYLRNGLKVYVNDKKIRDYIGYDVNVNLALDSNYNLYIVSYEIDYSSVSELTVTKDIFVSEVGAYVEFEYYEDIENDSKTTEVDISKNAMVYVNFEKVGSVSGNGKDAFEELASKRATVKFVGSKGEDFSKIFITEKLYYQVENIYPEDEYIDLGNGSIELSKESRGNDSFFYTIYKDGEIIDLSEIKENDVLSIVAPGNDIDMADYILIYVSDKTITGTVTGAKADGITYYINDVEYKAFGKNLLSVGDKGTFYFTEDGLIYSTESNYIDSANYGFITKVGSAKSFGETSWQLRLVTEENIIETYTIAPTLKVSQWSGTRNVEYTYKRTNGTQDTFMQELSSYIQTFNTEADAYAAVQDRLIKYTISENGEIDSITLATDNVCTADLNKTYNVTAFSYATCKPQLNRLGAYTYNSDTKFINAPISEKWDYDYTCYTIDEDDVSFILVDSLEKDKQYTGYAYNRDTDRNISAVVITDYMNNLIEVIPPPSPELPQGEGYGLIFKVGSTKSFGENIWQLRMLIQNDTIVTYNIAPSIKITQWNGSNNLETIYKRSNGGQNAIMNTLCDFIEDAYFSGNASNDSIKNCLIKYKSVGDEITEITLVSDNVPPAAMGNAYNVSSFSGGTYLPKNNLFAGHYYNDNTVFFYMPIKNGIVYSENAAVISKELLDEDCSYSGLVYDKNPSKIIGATLITNDIGFIKEEATEELSAEKYGFITKVGSTKSFGENTWQLRIFTENNTINTYTVAPTLKATTWNGSKNVEVTYKRANGGQDDFMCALDGYTSAFETVADAYEAVQERLIRYKTNSSGEIVEIILAANNVSSQALESAYDVTSVQQAEYKPSENKFAEYNYTDSSKFLYAPISINSYDYQDYAINEDEITFITSSSLDKDVKNYKGYIYNINSSGEFEFAVITSDLGFSGKHQPLAIVSTTSEGLNSNGEKAITITVFQSGETKTLVIDEDCKGNDCSDLETGDIIQYVTNTHGEITNAQLIFSANNSGLGELSDFAKNQNYHSDSSVKYVYGILCNVMSTGFDITYNFDDWYYDGLSEPYFFNYNDTTTAAKVDVSKLITSPTTSISKLSYISSFRATKPTYTQKYVVVARLEDGDIVDAISYLLPENVSTGVFNAHPEYVITY